MTNSHNVGPPRTLAAMLSNLGWKWINHLHDNKITIPNKVSVLWPLSSKNSIRKNTTRAFNSSLNPLAESWTPTAHHTEFSPEITRRSSRRNSRNCTLHRDNQTDPQTFIPNTCSKSNISLSNSLLSSCQDFREETFQKSLMKTKFIIFHTLPVMKRNPFRRPLTFSYANKTERTEMTKTNSWDNCEIS